MKEPSQTKDELLNSIEQFLAELLQKLEPQTETTGSRGRPRVLPALCLWGGMLVCVLRGFSSQLSLWRLLRLKGLWSYPRFLVSDQAVYKRLAEGGTAELEQLFGQVSAVLSEHLAPYEQRQLAPFATAVVALDETTLDPVARMLPSLREVPKGTASCCPASWQGSSTFASSSG